MFGVKINELDNSDGTIKTFESIFPNSIIAYGDNVEYVEIGDIVKFKYISQGTPFIRELIFFNDNYEEIGRINHDFGANNFIGNEDFIANDKIKYKYYARDLDGNLLAKAYSCQELADKLGCKIGIIKNRVNQKRKTNDLKYSFNVTRVEL